MSRPVANPLLILSRGGVNVDTTGPVWNVDPDAILDFAELHVAQDDTGGDVVLDAFASYIRHLVRRNRPRTVMLAFGTLRRALRIKAIRDAVTASDSSLLIEAMSATRHLSHGARYGSLTILRAWFTFAADSNLEGFDPDVATALQAIQFRRGRQGVAVLRQDPRNGPLSDTETKALEQGLWRAAEDGALPTATVLAGLLFFTFGFNPEHLRRLHQDDLAPKIGADTLRVLRVPRIKKGAARDRANFMERELEPPLAALFDRLVAENHGGMPHRPDYPLFRPRLEGGSSEAYVDTTHFVRVCESLTRALELKADDGSRLHLFPRRLRYSFASRAVAGGASEEELMELLDHRTLATVVFYYKARLDIVPKLDAALGTKLAIFAEVAMARTRPPVVEPIDPDLHIDRVPFACVACRNFRPVEAKALRMIGRNLSDAEPALGRPDLGNRVDEALDALEKSS